MSADVNPPLCLSVTPAEVAGEDERTKVLCTVVCNGGHHCGQIVYVADGGEREELSIDGVVVCGSETDGVGEIFFL
jgi:hypothetical protein